MKRSYYIFFIIFIISSHVHAQSSSVNIDRETVSAMTAAFASEKVTESYYNEQIQSVLNHYKSAEIASAGILSSKFLDRKAMTNLGLWSSSTENYYYRRIYKMVSARIMPKIWSVAGMMLKNPQNAFYWGTYLYEVCEQTKSLCMQFESVVTNSTLTFSDIAFLEIKADIASLLKLSELGNFDWNTLLNEFGNIQGNFTIENLKNDIDNLYRTGANLASAGMGNIYSSILGGSSFNGTFIEKAKTAVNIAQNAYDLYDASHDNIGSSILHFIGGENAIGNLFDISDYNMSSWITDYSEETKGRYFRQRWYIYKSSLDIGKANISVPSYKNPSETYVVYEEVFDSYTMDYNAFKAQMKVKLREYNSNEEGDLFAIGCDAKNYYEIANESKLKGTESVTISVTCSDGAVLGQGATQYKCSSCGRSVSQHTKECSMKTTVTDDGLDTSELDEKENSIKEDISELDSRINALEQENEELLRKISISSIEEAVRYRQQYNDNKEKIKKIQLQKRVLEQKIKEIEKAKDEAAAGENVQTDDFYRIPAIMKDCRTAYNMSWKNSGSWDGYTFRRRAVIPGIHGIITFKATISIARKPKYVFGVKVHRAIVQIQWELTSEYSDTQVVEVIQLDPSMNDKEKTDLVNSKISEVAITFPNCRISTEYAKSNPAQEDNTDDTYHLLWSGDRLEIAREIDSRLTHIYADLVSLEKLMSYKHSFIDILKDIEPYVDTNRGRRMELVEKCRQRWLKNGRPAKREHNGEKENNERES